MAGELSIDLPNWQSYCNKFRRSLIKEPNALLDDQQTIAHLCAAVENIHDISVSLFDDVENEDELVKSINKSKQSIFDVVLGKAKTDLSSYIESVDDLQTTSDLRVPHEWYPATRLMKRKIIYHGGPTNSGKTYQALQRLKHADVSKGGGLYCGPLRLLALEVYENLNRQGVFTSLLTGQEKREVPDATHVSCTVEMVDIQSQYDVAVIDEIQMIGSRERGYAWTRALQGLQAKEVHVCGGLEAADIVRSLAASTGDDFELRKYERLSNLQVNTESLRGDYSKIRPGDCIVAFSKADIFSIRRQVEELTPYKCAVIYGQLPPETRSTQARLFNEAGSGFDVLVASDAIGMGLNLNIRRIVFHSTLKNGGPSRGAYWVDPSSVKQIAGRAGRMSSDYKIGEVSAWQDADLAYVRAVMSWDIPQLPAVGIFPSVDQIELFSTQLDATMQSEAQLADMVRFSDNAVTTTAATTTPVQNGKLDAVVLSSRSTSTTAVASTLPVNSHMRLSSVIERFVKLAKTDKRYFLCDYEGMIVVSNWLHSIPLSISDRFTFSNAPVSVRDSISMTILYNFAATYALQRPVPLKVRLSKSPPRDLDAFSELCIKHSVLELYLWLSIRFPKYFIERDMCVQQKAFALGQIEACLSSSTMGQTYSFAREYQKLRQTSGPYPPSEFGEQVCSTAKSFIDALPAATRFVPPKGGSTAYGEDSHTHGRKHHVAGSSVGNNRKFVHVAPDKGASKYRAKQSASTNSRHIEDTRQRQAKREDAAMPILDLLTATD